MEKAEVLALLKPIIRSVLDDDEIDFDESTLIRDVPEWDSLNNMHIVVRIEKKLGLDFQQSDFEGVQSVGDLLELIRRHQNK